ncbi:alba domain-containing protein, partial [Haematococcus lacustris]
MVAITQTDTARYNYGERCRARSGRLSQNSQGGTTTLSMTAWATRHPVSRIAHHRCAGCCRYDTMENYVRLKKSDDEAVPENEVRIQSSGKLRYYIAYAISIVNEKGFDTFQLKAMGRAINKTVAVAEIVKRRVPGLHQITEFSSLAVVDTWMPKEEGPAPLQVTRNVSAMTITLSTAQLDTNHPGYQAPLGPEELEQVSEQDVDDMMASEARKTSGRPRGRGRGRGGRGRGDRGPPHPGGEGPGPEQFVELGAD